ncbi:sugar ABC transporter substrate-binding protein [Catenulispora rubra]|uniref:sugar ABC transporter substrate-binding protein n=1 Tax=Catenulispora rubra TaxID=280293 RepID=UPI001891FF3E|nr:sugar ABC transporter substrate-binding protein [Catenulispora rubra]
MTALRSRALTVLLGVSLSAALLAGCSKTDSSASGSFSAAGLQAATDYVGKYRADVTSASLPASSPPVAPGRLIVTIPCSYAAENCKRGVDAFAEAAKAVGWETKMIDPAGDPDKGRAAVQTAIRLKANGIFFFSGNGDQLKPALDDARAAGLALVDAQGGPFKQGQFDTTVEPDAYDYGMVMGAQMTVATKGKGKILLVNDPEFPSVVQYHEGVLAALKKYCPGCKVTDDIHFQIAGLSTTLPTQFQAALAAHPDTDMVWAAYDAAATAVIPVIQRSTNGDKIQLVSSDGNAANLDDVKKGKVQTADVATSTEWNAYQALDEMNRIFNKESVPLTVTSPFKLITGDNLTTVPWNGDVDWRGTYLKLWGRTG